MLTHPAAAAAAAGGFVVAGAVSAADAHTTLELMLSGVMPGGVENVDICIYCATTAASSVSLLAS